MRLKSTITVVTVIFVLSVVQAVIAREPEISVSSLSYRINDGEKETVANEGMIILQPGDKLELVDFYYISPVNGGTRDRAAGEAYIRKDGAFDYNDGLFTPGVPIESGSHRIGDFGNWVIQPNWDRIAIVLLHYFLGGNETDDRFFINLQVGIPDFEVTSVNIISASNPPRIGEPVTIEAIIRNNTPDGPYPTYVECEINRYRAPAGTSPVFVGSHEFTINGNETITVAIDETWMPTDNWLYIVAMIVDPPYAYPDYEHDHGDIIETEGNDTYKDDEGIHFANNAQWKAVQVGTPDFEVTRVEIISTSTPAKVGEPVTIRVTIRNNTPDGPYPTYVECEINRFRVPGGTPPSWIGTHEITIDGNGEITVEIENTTDDGYLNGPWIPTTEDLYIIAVIVDPPYDYPNYEHANGDIIEMEDGDTYKDGDGIHFANNALWNSRCVYQNIPQTPGNSHTWLIGSLTKDQEGGPGYLLRSFGFDSCILNAYAYDQALGVIALTALDDHENAIKLLDELSYLQEEDGSFLFVWHAPRPKNVELEIYEKKMVGTNSWIVMAINFFSLNAQNRNYLDIARKCADWILTFQDDDGGIFGGMGDTRIFPDGKVTWKSVEHNLDAYSALYFLSQLVSDTTEREKYAIAAQQVKEWLYANWLDDEGRFRRGANDNYMITDTNTWGVLALGAVGPNGEDYTSGLKWCLDNTLLSESYQRCDGEVLEEVWGFDINLDPNSDYDDNPEFIAGEPHTGDGLDTVWPEGTLGFALASHMVEDYENYNRFLSEMARTQCENGGIPYSTSPGSAGEYISDRGFDGFEPDGFDDTDRTTTFLSTAGTAWYIVADMKVNPFRPGGLDAEIVLNFYTGWTLMSCPGDPVITDFATMFKEPIDDGIMNPDVFAWNRDTQSFEIVSICEFARGYWVQTLQNFSVEMEYHPRCSMICPLKPDWELMGSVAESVSWDDRTCDPAEVVNPKLFGWDGETQSFVVADNVEPGHGYYVHQIDNSTLILECASASTAPGKQVQPVVELTPCWEGIVSLNSGDHHQELAFGMHPSASAGLDILLDSPPPPVPRDCISKIDWVVDDPHFPHLYKSFVGDSSHAVWELSVELSEPGDLHWRNLPSTYRCLLWYDEQMTRMREGSFISLPAGEHELWLILDAFAALPKRTELLSNYPNPCNPETWIPYRLSGDGDVILTIYDVSGREVRRFHLHDQFAGEYTDRAHAIYWDGRNSVGEIVSSGVYFYTLQASGVSQTRKLVTTR